MKTKTRKHAPSGFTRGEKVSAKSVRRHARRHAAKSAPKEELVDRLDTLIPL